jgi:hypothetical protein
VPVWADELRSARQQAESAEKPLRPKADPVVVAQQRTAAMAAVQLALDALSQEIAQGHGKAAPKVAADLRQTLKEHGRYIDATLEAQVHAALTTAGELEGWQRWRADQIREELLAKAQALVTQPLGGRNGKPATKVVFPITDCGKNSTRPAARLTRWSRNGSSKRALNRRRASRSARP